MILVKINNKLFSTCNNKDHILGERSQYQIEAKVGLQKFSTVPTIVNIQTRAVWPNLKLL